MEVFKDKKLTSELLAASTGSNPVIVRNILGNLKKAGLIDIQRGTGGASLVANPEDVTILQVYQAVDSTNLDDIIGIHPNPSMICPVGNNINKLLEEPYLKITKAVQDSMEKYTLKDLLNNYQNICYGKEKK